MLPSNLPCALTGNVCPISQARELPSVPQMHFSTQPADPVHFCTCLGLPLVSFPSIFPEFLHCNWKQSSHVSCGVEREVSEWGC